LRRLDAAVKRRILRGTPIVRVKVWEAGGRIVYSDVPSLIGRHFALGEDESTVLRQGGVHADASDLNRPENLTERKFRRLVEVYVAIKAPDGTPLLYEDYERSSSISASSRRQWEALLPALAGALLVLYLIQLPLVYSLARRLRRRQREREELLRSAIDASDLERRRIAADLHDSAVQRLAGVSLSLAAAGTRNGGVAAPADDELRAAVRQAAAETRETIRELRTLLVDIYPPTLQRSGLAAALSDLVAPLRAAGVTVAVDVPEDAELSHESEALFYRVAQEAIRNARVHGHATRVDVALTPLAKGFRFSVHDDGRGFAAEEFDPERQDRHFGLRLMRDLVAHAGGQLEIVSQPAGGTSIIVTMRPG
jgi:signal transduction histidine kinase